MKYAIVTPTFSGHFWAIEEYLASFDKFVIDKENINIYFVISENEKKSFLKIVSFYKDRININVLVFEDILKRFSIEDSTNDLLNKYGKFSFQTLKKFYAMLAIPEEKMLVLDSESIWVSKTNMSNLFYDFFKKPFICFSYLNKRYFLSEFFYSVCDNVRYILKNNEDKWFIETFMWFYEKRILKDLFGEFGNPIDLVEKIYQKKKFNIAGLFEICLYCSFISKQNIKYGYDFIDVCELLSKNMSDNLCGEYIDNFMNIFKGESGIFEHALFLVNDNNYEYIKRIFNLRYFKIIRCDINLRQFFAKKIIKESNVKILASSEASLIKRKKYIYRLKFYKHYNKFLLPFKNLKKVFSVFNWFVEPFAIVYYYIKSIK